MGGVKTLVAGAVVGVMLASPWAAQNHRIERGFAPGGTVDLDLSAGEYTITASSDDRIRVEWDGPRADDIEVDIEIKGSRAWIETHGPLKDGARVRIELPRRTDIVADLSAGEFNLRGIEGSKNISARAGEVNIETGAAAQYRRVDASVRIGELNAEAFAIRKGGFFRSFTWNGRGPYDLRAHLTVGELNLTR